jgi:hypothetical protein
VNRRMSLVGAAVSAGSLIFASVAAPIASSKTHKSTKPGGPGVKCALSLATQVPKGDTQVIPPEQQGSNYGAIKCRKVLGSGVEVDQFKLLATGDTVGSFTDYFQTGTIRGKFHLTPQEGSFGSTGQGFASSNASGTVTVRGGTGAFAHFKGTGTSTCVSADAVHLSCTETLRLTP